MKMVKTGMLFALFALLITSCDPSVFPTPDLTDDNVINDNTPNQEPSGDQEISGNQVIMIGDSIFALTGQIKANLQRLTGKRYRDYTVSGAQLNGGFLTPIPTQYNMAKRQNPDIKMVIMDGGGNDVQIGASMTCAGGPTAACRNSLQPSLRAADRLFAQMRQDGVEHIVYMNYFYNVVVSAKPAFNWMHDEMAKLVQKYDGIIVDPMADMRPSYIGPDRIHPNAQGSKMLAEKIYATLVEYGLD